MSKPLEEMELEELYRLAKKQRVRISDLETGLKDASHEHWKQGRNDLVNKYDGILGGL